MATDLSDVWGGRRRRVKCEDNRRDDQKQKCGDVSAENTSTVAATGITPHTETLLVVRRCAKQFWHHRGQPILLYRTCGNVSAGSTGTIAAAGSTPRVDTTRRFRVFHAV